MIIFRFFILLLFFLFPFGELLRFDLGNGIVIKLFDITTGIVLISYLLLLVLKKISYPKINKYLLLFPLLAFVSLILNATWLDLPKLFIASLYLVRWISYFVLFMIISNSSTSFKKLISQLLFIDGAFIVVFGYVQYIIFQNLKPLYHLGWDDHLYRIFSVFLDPNFAGAFYVLYGLFVAGLLYKDIKNKNKRNNYLVVILFLTIGALLLTFSRSAMIMFVISSILFLILINKIKFILSLLFFLIVFFIIITPWYHVESINPFRIASSVARIQNYVTALGIITERPLFGVGFNAYRYAKEAQNVQMGWTDSYSHADAGVENSYLFILVTTGFFGFIAYLSMWYQLLRNTIFKIRKYHDIVSLICVTSTIGLFFNAFFINSLFYSEIMFWMWIIYSLQKSEVE